MVDWGQVRSDYPLLERCTYLDTASISPSPPVTRRAVDEFYDEKEQGYLSCGWRTKKEAAQADLATYLGTTQEELVFCSSTTEGVNLIANAIDWEVGDEVVITDLNFASNVYPWLRLRERGVKVIEVNSRDGSIHLDDLTSTITDRTRLVSLPHVSTNTGFRIDLAELRRAVGDDVFVNIDGVQAVGYCQPNLDVVDAYSFSIFKWLLGPFGLGVLYLDAESADRLEPPTVGYGSVVGGTERPFEGFELKPGPQKFQYTHANYPAIYALSAVLSYIEDIGPKEIRSRVDELTRALITEIRRLSDLHVLTDPDSCAGIIAFDHADLDSGEIVDRLAARDVHVADRGGHVRASCHFYNNQSDIDALIEAIERQSRTA